MTGTPVLLIEIQVWDPSEDNSSASSSPPPNLGNFMFCQVINSIKRESGSLFCILPFFPSHCDVGVYFLLDQHQLHLCLLSDSYNHVQLNNIFHVSRKGPFKSCLCRPVLFFLLYCLTLMLRTYSNIIIMIQRKTSRE